MPSGCGFLWGGDQGGGLFKGIPAVTGPCSSVLVCNLSPWPVWQQPCVFAAATSVPLRHPWQRTCSSCQTVHRSASPVATINTSPTYWLVTQTCTPPAAAEPPAPAAAVTEPSQLAPSLLPDKSANKSCLPTYFTVPGHRTRLQGPNSKGTAISLMPHHPPAGLIHEAAEPQRLSLPKPEQQLLRRDLVHGLAEGN